MDLMLTLERFEELVKIEAELYALYAAGVDSWSGYPTAMGILEDINKNNNK